MTSASFWLGDPRDQQQRVWLGALLEHGSPTAAYRTLLAARSSAEFTHALHVLSVKYRGEFCAACDGWCFPFIDALLVEYTYAFFDGQTYVTHYHDGFMTGSVHQEQRYSELIEIPFVPAPVHTPEGLIGLNSLG